MGANMKNLYPSVTEIKNVFLCQLSFAVAQKQEKSHLTIMILMCTILGNSIYFSSGLDSTGRNITT